jgi:quercetin dioxygenase-like cupin family protein
MTTDTTMKKQPLWFIANQAQVHLDGGDTDGACDLVEVAGRRGDMPPLHVHHEHDETFYVLEGRLSLHLPGQRVELRPGESFFAPRGIPHVYRVESDEARWLGVGNPAGFADFVRESSDVATAKGYPPADREPNITRVAEAAARYGIELLGPPGTFPA